MTVQSLFWYLFDNTDSGTQNDYSFHLRPLILKNSRNIRKQQTIHTSQCQKTTKFDHPEYHLHKTFHSIIANNRNRVIVLAQHRSLPSNDDLWDDTRYHCPYLRRQRFKKSARISSRNTLCLNILIPRFPPAAKRCWKLAHIHQFERGWKLTTCIMAVSALPQRIVTSLNYNETIQKQRNNLPNSGTYEDI